MKIKSYREWIRNHGASYQAALKLNIHHETAELMGWLTTKEKCNLKKQKLLMMAKTGQDRPSKHKNELGVALVGYTTGQNKKRGCYDAEFTKQITEIRPDWFNKVASKKQEIIELAKTGQDRPTERNHHLGKALSRYLKDPQFTRQLKKIRPDWFNGNKKQIKCHQNGKTYKSISNAAVSLSVSSCNVVAMLKGRKKSCKGYTFEYI
jgi:hypothetical protein